MKWFVFCLTILAVIFVISCSNGSTDLGNDDSLIGSIRTVKNTGIKSLFTSSISINSETSRNARALTEMDIKTLSYINDAGQNVPVIFITSNDKDVLLQITNIQQIGTKRLIADYSAIYEVDENVEGDLIYKNNITATGRTLIDMETGVLYDFSKYPRNTLYPDQVTLYADGDTLYATDAMATLYKIDLANLGSAVPLNNPRYNPANNILFRIGDKIICNYYSFDINASFVPKQVLPAILTNENCVLATPSYPFEISTDRLRRGTYFIDSNSDIWFYWIGGFDTMGGDIERQYISCKITINDEGQLIISNYIENSFPSYSYGGLSFKNNDDSARFYLSSNGIAIVKKDPSGIGISIEGITKTIPANLQDAFFYDNFLYWIDGTSIKRMELSPSGTEETIYSNSNIVNTFLHGMLFRSGDQVIFYQYFNATTVGTYSLSISNLSATPNLVSTSTVEIDNIMELQF